MREETRKRDNILEDEIVPIVFLAAVLFSEEPQHLDSEWTNHSIDYYDYMAGKIKDNGGSIEAMAGERVFSFWDTEEVAAGKQVARIMDMCMDTIIHWPERLLKEVGSIYLVCDYMQARRVKFRIQGASSAVIHFAPEISICRACVNNRMAFHKSRLLIGQGMARVIEARAFKDFTQMRPVLTQILEADGGRKVYAFDPER